MSSIKIPETVKIVFLIAGVIALACSSTLRADQLFDPASPPAMESNPASQTMPSTPSSTSTVPASAESSPVTANSASNTQASLFRAPGAEGVPVTNEPAKDPGIASQSPSAIQPEITNAAATNPITVPATGSSPTFEPSSPLRNPRLQHPHPRPHHSPCLASPRFQ